ncbi:hypothetical protein SUGI_1106960 [Cryptomeria japonica]|nr:hypothetical protein SUGI_1106960 [Cryptomeria japonica]
MVALLGGRSLVGKNNATSHSEENVRDEHGLIVSKIPVLRDKIAQGTRKVINACLACKVKKLIYESSPSIVCDGIHEIINGDKFLPYSDKVQGLSYQCLI